jgi:branched-chain amino acid transport system substrate-binding protein
MTKTSKIIWWIVGIVVVVCLVWWGISKNGGSGNVIKIGAILPLTGNSADLGEASQNALKLALADLKGTKYKYEVVFEDDGNFDSSLAASAINKLISADGVKAVVTVSSGTGNVVSPIATANKLIHFSCASDPNVAQGPYNFIDWTPPSEEVKLLVTELEKKGYKRIGLFDMNQQGTIAMIDEFKKQIVGTGIQVVTDQTFDPATTDFRSMIVNAEQAKPDIYFLNLFSPGLENLAKQLKEMNVKTPITSVEAFEYTDQTSLFEGDWYIQGADAAPWFAAEYKDAYGKDYKMCAPNIYDAFNLIVKGYETAGQGGGIMPNIDSVVGQILQIKNYNGALGNVSVGSDHIVDSQAVVRMIENGQPVTIGN